MTPPKLPRGITRGPYGWRISVRVKGTLHQKRFKPSTSQATVESALAKLKTWKSGKRSPLAGTLSADITHYLEHYYGQRAGRDERERHLMLWRNELGPDTWRSTITREDVSRVLHGWRSAGLSPDTCNKRRAALLACFNTLDGKGGVNPVRDVPKFRVAAPQVRGLNYRQIVSAFKKMPKCRTRARLKVMAYTGARPVQVRRLKPDDWDTTAHTLLLQSTEKGHGTKPHRVPLSSQAIAALKEFDDTDAWGSFTSAPMGRMWKAAALAAKIDGNVRPYDLRHSFGTQVYLATGDIRATKELLGHSTLAMTERYTIGAIPERERTAITAFDAAMRPRTRSRVAGALLPIRRNPKKTT